MTVDQLLAEHTDEVADLARRLIDHITAAAAWSEAKVYRGWHGVGFHHPDAGYVAGVFPRRDVVRVLFERGHLLGDVEYLDGDGQTRHIDFPRWDDGRIASVDEMLDRALPS